MKTNKLFLISLILLLTFSLVSASRLPTVDGDSDNWGTILNEYLGVSLNGSGQLNSLNQSLEVVGNIFSTGTSWTSRTSPTTNWWFPVTYGNGLFVSTASVGSGNYVMTSPDGITWTQRAASSNRFWRDITYGNGLFVAVANANYNNIMTSPDGITWTDRTTGFGNDLNSIAYGNNTFVAVSDIADSVVTSPDGITWTNRTGAANNNWMSVTYGNELFVAVSSGGESDGVMTSPDGITWTSRNSASTNQWLDVTYGNGLFVAVSSNGTGDRIMTSSDGITWTSRTNPVDNDWKAVTYGEGLFVAVAASGTGDRIMTSSNGINWTSRTNPADNNWWGITYGNGVFVATSNSGTNDSVMTSGKIKQNIIPHNNFYQGGMKIMGGNVGIGETNPQQTLVVAGDLNTTGTSYFSSIVSSEGTINGNLMINGNLTLIGSYLNTTVTNQYLNGSFLPSITSLFDIGSSSFIWNNLYLTKIFATDWTNVTITESQVSDADWWDADADVGADEISESKINFDTACAAGNHLYVSGDNLACEADTGNSSFNQSFTDDIYVPYTGATSAVTLGDNDFSVGGADLYVKTSTGQVGIGTTDIDSDPMLHIFCDSGSSLLPSMDYADVIIEDISSTTDSAVLSIMGSKGEGSSEIRFGDNTTEKMGEIVYNHAGDTFNFTVGAVENIMTLGSSGNLFLGGSALTGTSSAMRIDGSFADGNYIDFGDYRKIGVFHGGNFFMGYNFLYNSTANSYEYEKADEAAGVEFTTDGEIKFKTATSGSVGDAFTPTTQMTIENDGEVIVNNTNVINDIYLPLIPSFYGEATTNPVSQTLLNGDVYTVTGSSQFPGEEYSVMLPFYYYYNSTTGGQSGHLLRAMSAADSWATAGEATDYWLKIELPRAVAAQKVAVRGREDSSENPLNWTLQGSNDDSAWTTVLSEQPAMDQNNAHYYTFTNNVKYKYYRIYAFTSAAESTNSGMSLFQLWTRI
jgi:hypothetical protein